MLKFTRLARVGFYVTLFGVFADLVHYVRPMPYFMHKVFDWSVTALLAAGLAFSIFALITGREAKISFKEGRSSYWIIGVSIAVSGFLLANTGYVMLRRFLWRFQINI
jgi:hypothetical protein